MQIESTIAEGKIRKRHKRTHYFSFISVAIIFQYFSINEKRIKQ